jgi:hypothetical protein
VRRPTEQHQIDQLTPGDAADVAVLEPVAVAFEADDVGVMHEPVVDRGGGGVNAL